jgi:hypothetical protein
MSPSGSGSSGACFRGCGFQEGSTVALQAWREPRLQVGGALGPTCLHRLLIATAAGAGRRKPNLWAVGVLRPDSQQELLGMQYRGAAANPGEPSLLACACCYLWKSRCPESFIYRGTGFPGISG